jgi:hypothetical protein
MIGVRACLPGQMARDLVLPASDFERAEPGSPVRDLVRLKDGPWDQRPTCGPPSSAATAGH